MKKYIPIIILALSLITGCKQSSANKENKQQEQIAEVYTCPMHPEVKSDTTGNCPKCGMALVKATEEDTDHPDSSSNVDDEIE